MFFMSRIDYSEFPQKRYLHVGQVEKRINKPSSKIQSPGLSDTTFFARWITVYDSSEVN